MISSERYTHLHWFLVFPRMRSLKDISIVEAKKLPRHLRKTLPRDLRASINEEMLPNVWIGSKEIYSPYFDQLPVTNTTQASGHNKDHIFFDKCDVISNASKLVYESIGDQDDDIYEIHKAINVGSGGLTGPTFHSKNLSGISYAIYSPLRTKTSNGLLLTRTFKFDLNQSHILTAFDDWSEDWSGAEELNLRVVEGRVRDRLSMDAILENPLINSVKMSQIHDEQYQIYFWDNKKHYIGRYYTIQ